MTKRVLFKLFVEERNVGRAMNIMTLAGITGFFLHKYRGLSPESFKKLSVEELENIKKVYNIIENKSQKAVVIGTVVKEEKAKKIENLLKEKLKNEKWTVMKIPIIKVKVNRV